MTGAGSSYTELASYRRCVARIGDAWPKFLERRRERLRQGLFEAPVEKIAENILEDLLTTVLDWSLADVNLQVGRADVVLSELGIKRLVLEVKRPGALVWRRPSVEAALEQARRYAEQQNVGAVAVSDGHMLYAADLASGGFRDRVLINLDAAEPPESLWWISVHGVYRPFPGIVDDSEFVRSRPPDADDVHHEDALRHPKYHLPARCFAYVGRAEDVHTWKLPYQLADGTPDTKRLPKAIQSILSNYRGVKVDIPRESVGDVLVRLSLAAANLHKMPCQTVATADAYVEAHQALTQLGRLHDVGCCS